MRRLVAIALLLGLMGCVRAQSVEEVEPLLREPLSVSDYFGPPSLSQVVTSTHEGMTHSLRVETEIAPGRMAMVGLSHLGVPLFELVLEGGKLQSRSLSGERLPFDPRYILSDFQLAYWPFQRVQAALKEGGYELRQDEHETERLVYDGKGELVARIHFQQPGNERSALLVQHFDLPYEIRIETIGQGGST